MKLFGVILTLLLFLCPQLAFSGDVFEEGVGKFEIETASEDVWNRTGIIERNTGIVFTSLGISVFSGGFILGAVEDYPRPGEDHMFFDLFASAGAIISIPFFAIGIPLWAIGNKNIKIRREAENGTYSPSSLIPTPIIQVNQKHFKVQSFGLAWQW